MQTALPIPISRRPNWLFLLRWEGVRNVSLTLTRSLLGQEMEGDWDSYFFPFFQMPVGENLMCPV